MLDEVIVRADAARPPARRRARSAHAASRPPAGRRAESWHDSATITINDAMAVFEEAGDHAGMAKGWRLLAWRHGTACTSVSWPTR